MSSKSQIKGSKSGLKWETKICGQILKSLQKCKLLTHLNLGRHNLENEGEYLVELIKSIGVDQPLKELHLPNCSIPKREFTEMLTFLSNCRYLTHLDLSGNEVGKAGIHIAEIVNTLHSALQLLYLGNCSIPTDTLQEILTSLKKCKQLTHLDLGGNNLETSGKHLVELIKSFGVDTFLQQLYLQNCSIPEGECTEMLKCLTKYRHLTHLNLSGNRVGEAGINIVEIVENAELDSPLQVLYLRDCSIPTDTLQEILKSLKKCKQLKELDLAGYSLVNSGEHLVELIKSFGVDAPLQRFYLQNCSIPEGECTEMLKCLTKYRHLTHLNLSGNRVGEAGINIVEIVENAELDSALQSLYLNNCSIPTDLVQEILKSLKKCKKLTHLDLSGHSLRNAADQLLELINSFVADTTLKQLYLRNCSIPEKECTEMLQNLSEFRHLTHLDLSGNKIRKAGIHMVKAVIKLRCDSPLQSLCLRDCSIPTDTLQEILTSLKKCKQLTHLDLGGNNLENNGDHLVELIKSFGVDPSLQQLYLSDCSMPERECTEMLQCLSEFQHLTHMNLSGNKVGKAGKYIVEIVKNFRLDSPLQLLYLRNCSITNDTLQEILKCLKKCKKLTHLDLGWHKLEKNGGHLVELIKSFGVDAPLQQLYLQNCSIPEGECTEMLKCLTKYRHLTHLNLSGNRVGKTAIHIVEIVENAELHSPLQLLYLRDCSIPSNTMQEILESLKKCQQLTHFDLGGHNLENDGVHLVEFIKSFGVDPSLQQLHLQNCSIQEKDCTKMLQYLSEFRHVTHLNLNGNLLGKAGIHIVEIMKRAGIDSPLQLLYLGDCSIPTDTLREILKSLKKCKQLTCLDLGGHNLAIDGEHLVELIKSFVIDQPLQLLYLPDCSIQEKECTIMFQYLSEFRHLTHLNLSGNRVGKAGIHTVKMVERAGKDSPLQLLFLRDCSIPTHILREILKCLKRCKELTHLDLGGHNLHNDEAIL